MMRSIHAKSALAAAIATALAAPLFAQAASEDKKALDLERVVVTATVTQGSKMKQSLSVSTLDADQIQATQATSAGTTLHTKLAVCCAGLIPRKVIAKPQCNAPTKLKIAAP